MKSSCIYTLGPPYNTENHQKENIRKTSVWWIWTLPINKGWPMANVKYPTKNNFPVYIYMYIWWTFIYKQLLLLDVHQPVHTVFTSFAFFVNNPYTYNKSQVTELIFLCPRNSTMPSPTVIRRHCGGRKKAIKGARRHSKSKVVKPRKPPWHAENGFPKPRETWFHIYGYVSNCRMQSGMFV